MDHPQGRHQGFAPRPIPLHARTFADAIDGFLATYPNYKTRSVYDRYLNNLQRTTGRVLVAGLTEADIYRWCTDSNTGKPLANNSVRTRIALVRNFIAWSIRAGHIEHDPAPDLSALMRRYPRLYGKAQGTYPPRWLTREEASALIATCQDGTDTGLRDEIILRLGLAGLRRNEIICLTFGAGRADGTLHWIGKGNRSRSITMSPKLRQALNEWHRRYTAAVGPPAPTDRIICARQIGNSAGQIVDRIRFGAGCTKGDVITKAVQQRADQAGLGHIAPHDLRRSCAALLYNDRTPEGAHYYDLRDIQQVLQHANPGTTAASYLNHLDHDAQDRAAATLDL